MPAVAGTMSSAAPATATAVLVIFVMRSPERVLVRREVVPSTLLVPLPGPQRPKSGVRRVPWRAVADRGRCRAHPVDPAPWLAWGARTHLSADPAAKETRVGARPRCGTAGPHRPLREPRPPVLRPARLRPLGRLPHRQAGRHPVPAPAHRR